MTDKTDQQIASISRAALRLRQKREKLEKMLAEVAADERKAEQLGADRRTSNRRKIIPGAELFTLAANVDKAASAMIERIKNSLHRDQDRAAFGMSNPPKDAQKAKTNDANQSQSTPAPTTNAPSTMDEWTRPIKSLFNKS